MQLDAPLRPQMHVVISIKPDKTFGYQLEGYLWQSPYTENVKYCIEIANATCYFLSSLFLLDE